ncbi:MAG: tetratricopeptide repeat protein [Candidatus Latescibacteria bacterium]|nr:tetratricopeptide repeat protein [Candidatus Latescibacterota bacterium]
MNIGYAFLVVMVGMAYFVTGIPTPDEMGADFDAAQKFYTSGAYDQALEKYADINAVESRFLNEDKVIEEFGTMLIPIKDATLYQSGNCYYKMIELENEKANTAKDDAEKEKSKRLAIDYADKGTDFFDQTQERTKNAELQSLAQNRIISTWYLIPDYDRVIQEGRELIEKYPESPDVLDAMYNIGWAYYDTKRYDESISMFEELIARFPTGTKPDRAMYQIGESFFDQGKYAEAVPFYQRLVEKQRINELTDLEITRIQREKLAGLTDETALDLAAKAQLKVGACYANIGDFAGAETAYKRVAELFKFNKNLISEAYQRLADMHMDRGDFESSIRAYRDAIDEVPDKIFSAKMQWLICQRYFEHGYFEEAVSEYTNYITSYSDVAFRAGYDIDEAFYNLARSHYELGSELIKSGENETGLNNIEQAISMHERVLKDYPDTPLKMRVYFHLALAYQKNNTPEYLMKAIDNYNLLLTEYPETPYRIACYFQTARAYQEMEKYDDAIAQYQKIIDEFPNDSQLINAWFEMALAYRKSNREEAAVEPLLKVDRSNKQLFTSARLLAAQTLRKTLKWQETVTVINYAVEDTSAIDSPYRLSQLYIMRGTAQKNLNNFEESIADYTAAYNLNQPETQEMASVYRAGVYIEQEQFARAERDLKELMNSDNEQVRRDAQIRLAIISVRQDKSAQAIATYLGLYNSTEDPIEKLGFLRNLIQLNAQAEDWDGIEKYCNMMLESEVAEGQKPEGANFFYKEEAYYYLATAAESREDYPKAVEYLLAGYNKFPNSFFSSDMLLKVGVMYLTRLRSQEDALDLAAEYFEKYIKAFPDTPNTEMAHYYLGFCYYNGRRFIDSDNTFRSFTQKYPNSDFTPEAYFYYSDSSYNLGNLEDCIRGFDVVINKYPKHERAVEALYTKAWALLDLEREEEAIATLQMLIDKYPDSQFAPSSLFSIADYYYNEQNYTAAMENYQLVMERYPDSEVAEKVPETITDLKETIAYLEYEKGWSLFTQAQETKDLNIYRQAAEIFNTVVTEYPYTESEIGAYANMGICYEALGEWQKAADAYDQIMRRYEEGAQVGQESYTFARMHKDYIVANRF